MVEFFSLLEISCWDHVTASEAKIGNIFIVCHVKSHTCQFNSFADIRLPIHHRTPGLDLNTIILIKIDLILLNKLGSDPKSKRSQVLYYRPVLSLHSNHSLPMMEVKSYAMLPVII